LCLVLNRYLNLVCVPSQQKQQQKTNMSVRLGVAAIVLALCAVSVQSQVWQYVSQSFSLVRSDTLEGADYELLANVTSRDGGEVQLLFLFLF